MSRTDFESEFFEKHVPKKFANVTLALCDKQPKSYVDYARDWAKHPESVVLMGPVGRGKTHFSFAMIREAMRQDSRLWPRYYTSPQLDALLLSLTRDEGNFVEFDNAQNSHLLFIDDFGRETRSDRASRQYFDLINFRYANNLTTMISTNLTFDGISVGLNDAIASRFQEFQIIEFGGQDLRIQRKIG